MKPKRKVREIVLRNGKPSAVILDIEEYQEILERLEDVEDLKLLKAMRKRTLQLQKTRGLSKGIYPECMTSSLNKGPSRDLKALSAEEFHRIIRDTDPGGQPETLGMPKDLDVQSDWRTGLAPIGSSTRSTTPQARSDSGHESQAQAGSCTDSSPLLDDYS